MAARRKDVLDIREMVRRFRMGDVDRRIAREMGGSRNTIAKYRAWAGREGFLTAEAMPDPETLQERLKACQPAEPPGPPSALEKYRDYIVEQRAKGVEIQALLGLLRERSYEGSYSSLRRYVLKMENRSPDAVLRVETAPGEEAQVDFGFGGWVHDERTGRLRKFWVFVMTLSWSRHMYVEAVFDQSVATWVGLHARAFAALGGVVARVVLDNLKAAIVKAVVHEPEAQRSYRELAEHYDFLIAPCRPKKPEHKGKVESGVHYVKRNALAGRQFGSLREINEHLARWTRDTAGVRDHGTTKVPPLVRFEHERTVLKPLPSAGWELTVWKTAMVHRDGYVVFEDAWYSAPWRLVGQELWLRATPQKIELWLDHERVATHARATSRGERITLRDHLSPYKSAALDSEPDRLRARAAEVGPATAELVEHLLGERPMDRRGAAMAVLNLGAKAGATRLEAACRRAVAFGQPTARMVKNILKSGLDVLPIEDPGTQPAPLPCSSVFARSAADLLPSNRN